MQSMVLPKSAAPPSSAPLYPVPSGIKNLIEHPMCRCKAGPHEMVEPHYLAGDHYSYDKDCIEGLFAGIPEGTIVMSPITGKPLSSRNHFPNADLQEKVKRCNMMQLKQTDQPKLSIVTNQPLTQGVGNIFIVRTIKDNHAVLVFETLGYNPDKADRSADYPNQHIITWYSFRPVVPLVGGDRAYSSQARAAFFATFQSKGGATVAGMVHRRPYFSKDTNNYRERKMALDFERSGQALFLELGWDASRFEQFSDISQDNLERIIVKIEADILKGRTMKFRITGDCKIPTGETVDSCFSWCLRCVDGNLGRAYNERVEVLFKKAWFAYDPEDHLALNAVAPSAEPIGAPGGP